MDQLQMAIETLLDSELTCVVYDENGHCFSSEERGVKPLLSLLTDNKDGISGMYVADKIIGKAAAMLMVYGRVKECYGQIISTPALELLDRNSIPVSYDIEVHYIENKDRTDVCPLEKCVSGIEDPQEGFTALHTLVEEMRRKA